MEVFVRLDPFGTCLYDVDFSAIAILCPFDLHRHFIVFFDGDRPFCKSENFLVVQDKFHLFPFRRGDILRPGSCCDHFLLFFSEEFLDNGFKRLFSQKRLIDAVLVGRNQSFADIFSKAPSRIDDDNIAKSCFPMSVDIIPAPAIFAGTIFCTPKERAALNGSIPFTSR